MNAFFSLKGKVLFVQDETRELPDKDKDGNRLATSTKHRMTSIQILVVNPDKSARAVTVNGFDLPATFQVPKEGEEWATPEIRVYDAMKPGSIQVRI